MFPDSPGDQGALPKQPQPFKVEVPKDPPADLLKVNFNSDGVSGLDDETPTDQQKVSGDAPAIKDAPIEKKKEEPVAKSGEEPEKKEDKKPEDKKEDKKEDGMSRFMKPPKGQEKKGEEKKKADAVDYNDLPDNERENLKHMSAITRESYAKLFRENRDLKKNKESTYYQHPEAYTLHPDYRSALADISAAEQEGQYWLSQLELCKLGKPIRGLTGRDKNGNLVQGDEVPANDKIEEVLRSDMQKCFAVAEQRRGNVDTYKKNFQKSVQTDMVAIQTERANRFPWVADPKLLEYSIPTPDGDKPIKQIRNDIISVFPGYMRNTPAVEACADLMVALVLSKAENEELKRGKQVAETKVEEATRVEPSSSARGKADGNGKAIGGVSQFSLEGSGVEV